MSNILKNELENLLGRTRVGDVRWRPTDRLNVALVRIEGASIVLVNHQVCEKEDMSI